MGARINIVVASRSQTVADAVVGRIAGDGRYQAQARVIVNGHTDPLHDVHPRPDVLVLHHSPGHGELEHLASLSPDQRPRLLVLGPADDAGAMRLAMRAGAADYLPEPVSAADLVQGLEHVCEELAQKRRGSGSLTVVMNGKGGSGASFVAANIACAMAENSARRTTLMDLDLQFGGLARYLDLAPERGIREALGEITQLDQVAADAFLTPHRSGLRLLAAPHDGLYGQMHAAPDAVDALLQMFLAAGDRVVADLPQRIDGFSSTVLERADRVLLVVQQTLGHVNCAARLLHIMCSELGMQRDGVSVVLNRHVRNAIIEPADIRRTLRVEHLHVVPNQYKLVAESIDAGSPVVASAKSSAAAKSLREIAEWLDGPDEDRKRRGGFFSRAIPNLLGQG